MKKAALFMLSILLTPPIWATDDCLDLLIVSGRPQELGLRYVGQIARDLQGRLFTKEGWPQNTFALVVETCKSGYGVRTATCVNREVDRIEAKAALLGWNVDRAEMSVPSFNAANRGRPEFDWLDSRIPQSAEGPVLYIIVADEYRNSPYAAKERGYIPSTWRQFDQQFGLVEPSAGENPYQFVSVDLLKQQSNLPERACMYVGPNKISCFYRGKQVAIVQIEEGRHFSDRYIRHFNWTGEFAGLEKSESAHDERLITLIRSVAIEMMQRSPDRKVSFMNNYFTETRAIYRDAGFWKTVELSDGSMGISLKFAELMTFEIPPVDPKTILPSPPKSGSQRHWFIKWVFG